MKLFFYFAYTNFSNTYIVGPEEPGDALIIDPGVMDIKLLELIERNGYYIRYIILTHAHEGHAKGISTLLRIYDADIYSGKDKIMNIQSSIAKHGDILKLGDFTISVIGLPGHTSDSLAYKINDMIFTGDALGAGTVGPTVHSYAHALNVQSLNERILSLDEKLPIFPGHGPPTTVRAERAFNHYISEDFSAK